MNLTGNQIYRFSIILIILAIFTPVSLVSKSAECAMVDSQMILPGGKTAMREIDAEKVRSMLENKIVAKKLRAYGLSKEEVLAKMAKMSDGQIHQLAAVSDRITAGGVGGFFIATTTIILVAIIVILLLILVAVN
ncbi:MAG: PA2779 family protein [Ignavibacteriales bacterium]